MAQLNGDQDGCFNATIDACPKKDMSWSDTNPDGDYGGSGALERLKCRGCDSTSFEILSVPDCYETLAHCKCGLYYIVHSG